MVWDCLNSCMGGCLTQAVRYLASAKTCQVRKDKAALFSSLPLRQLIGLFESLSHSNSIVRKMHKAQPEDVIYTILLAVCPTMMLIITLFLCEPDLYIQ